MAYGEAIYDGVVAAGATTLTVTIGPVAPNRTWTVSQVSIELAAAPAGAACYLRKGTRLITPLIPTGDVAGGDPPVVLRGGESLTVNWTGVTAGQAGHVLAIYEEVGHR